ncbi:hypothetical protein ACFOUS_22185 [Deinococcus metalli]|uniref:hypothetical protein n=1 Tax=Deinococcus metalli TaxID=1141878 RepID=UPI003620D041
MTPMPDLQVAALTQGFGVSAAHVMGVSALNTFVLRQAIQRHHPVVAGATGILADATFILLGATGVGPCCCASPHWPHSLRGRRRVPVLARLQSPARRMAS